MKINIYFHEKNSKRTVRLVVFVLIDSSNRTTFSLLLTLFLEKVNPFLQKGQPFRAKRSTLSRHLESTRNKQQTPSFLQIPLMGRTNEGVRCIVYLCRLARCWRYLAFCFALPEPCAPVTYFFFLALVFTLSSSFFGPDDPLKLMPFSNIL